MASIYRRQRDKPAAEPHWNQSAEPHWQPAAEPPWQPAAEPPWKQSAEPPWKQAAALPWQPSFSPADLHWAIAGWARVAPDVNGWMVRHVAGFGDLGEALLIAPPASTGTPWRGSKFVIACIEGQAVLFVDVPAKSPRKIAEFPSLIDALLGLCPLDATQQRRADELADASASALHALAGARPRTTIEVDGGAWRT